MKPLLRHYLRIDPRSLGAFRIAFGLVLIRDLLSRWKYIDDFYGNEGVLPNHNHLYNLKSEGKSVWSALHAMSTGGEAAFGFCVILLFYVFFLFGFRTRAFQVMSLVSLISLSARNLLAEGTGNYVAIALCAFTMLLPLGSRFSIDALRETTRLANDGSSKDLNRRSRATDDDLDAHHAPGWSPTSIAGLGLLLQIALVYLSLAVQQTGAWRDGSALGKALHVARLASPLGFSIRNSGVLSLLTPVVYYAQFAIPVALFVPVLRGPSRGVAAILMAAHGIVLGLFFNFGLFGWSLAAASLLVISSETWEKWATKHDPARARTVIYDADCGICFWLCRLLKRLDTRHHLTFQGNDELEKEEHHGEEPERVLRVYDPKTNKVVDKPLPAKVTAELVDKTVVVVSASGEVATEGRAVAEVLLAIPGLAWKGRLLMLPGFSSLADALYRFVAPRRTQLSVELGLAACGSPSAKKDKVPDPLLRPVPPSTALRHRLTGAFREVLAVVVLATAVVQAGQVNKLPFSVPENATLSKIAWYARMLEKWDVLTPEPPTEQGLMVTDGLTRDEKAVDVLTGKPPVASFERPFELGQMWSDYLARIQSDDYRGYQQAFKTYIARTGPMWPAKENNDKLSGIDVYWMTGPTMGSSTPTLKRIFRQGRGGNVLGTQAPAPSIDHGRYAGHLDGADGALPLRPMQPMQPMQPPAPASSSGAMAPGQGPALLAPQPSPLLVPPREAKP